jgi:hypothetical protein
MPLLVTCWNNMQDGQEPFLNFGNGILKAVISFSETRGNCTGQIRQGWRMRNHSHVFSSQELPHSQNGVCQGTHMLNQPAQVSASFQTF